MRNKIVATAHFGPVYERKIHVYYRNELTRNEWRYCYSTNAHRTCTEAKHASMPGLRNSQVKASFAR